MRCGSELERVGCGERGARGYRLPVVPGRKAAGPCNPGRLLILIDQPATGTHGVTVVCARVSSGDQRQDLERQVARVTMGATIHGLVVDRVVTEVGSALDVHHGKLLALLRDPDLCDDRG